MTFYKELPKSKELTAFEFTLLQLILRFINEVESCKNQAVEYLTLKDDVLKAKEKADEYSYLKRSKHLNNLLDAFYDAASIATLTKILNEEKFTSEHTFLEPFLIPTAVLKKFSSYDKVLATDPKHHIAKKLGATIVV